MTTEFDYDAAVAASMNQSAATDARIGFSVAIDTNPDTHAEDLRIARRTGLPLPTVTGLPQEARRQDAMGSIDFDTLVQTSPSTAALLADPERAKLAHDDTENMGALESSIRAIQGPEASFASVVGGLAKSLPQGAEMARQGLRMQFADLLGFDDMSADAQRKYSSASLQSALSTPEFDSATARGVYSGGASMVRMVPGIAASIATRSTAPLLATIGLQTEADAYGKYRTRGATPGMAALGGVDEGLTEVATEMLPMGFAVKMFGKVGAGKFLSGLLMREVPTEQVATLVQDAIDTAVANPDKTWQQYGEERLGAAYQTLVATVTQASVMGAAGAVARRYASKEQTAAQGEQDTLQIEQLNKLAEASKLRARDPASFAQFIESATENGPVQHVFIDAQTLAQSGVAEQVAALSPAVAEQYQIALETGGQVRIPVSEYAATIAGTEYAQSLLDHLKTQPSGFSRAEAQDYMQNRAEQMQLEVEQVLAEKQDDDAFKASRDLVKTDIKAQLDGAGRFDTKVNDAYAVMVSNFYAVTAAKLGVTPQELHARYPMTVNAEGVVGAGTLNQSPVTVEEADEGAYLAAKSTAGSVSGTVRDGALHINFAEVEAAQRGRGEGQALYGALIQDALGRGLTVFSDVAVEADAVRVYESLARQGYGVVRLDGGGTLEDGAAYGKGSNTPAFQVTSAPMLQQNTQGNRGSFNPATLSITLLKNADLSTFLHESGHFFLEVTADIAGRNDAPVEIRKDMDALLQWFGVRDIQEWHNLDFEEKRSYHEQFARGFEAYLFEGTAPSIELQSTFQRFRAWMLNVYKELKNLNVELTPEVRAVFDRMLASTEQIQLAEQGRGMMPLFETAEQAGMSPDEFAEYQALGIDATQGAVGELEGRGLRDMQWLHNAKGREIKKLQKESKAKRTEVEMGVRRDVLGQPVYRAWQFLTNKLGVNDKIEAPAAPRKSDPEHVDPTIDSLFVAIAKLGGIKRDQAEAQWGFGKKERSPQPAFGKHLLRRTGGLSIDSMGEALAELGYLDKDEHGKLETNDLEAKFADELGGSTQYSYQYDYSRQQAPDARSNVFNPDALGAGRLDRGALAAEFGNDDNQVWKHLEALKMIATDGLHPDVVAELFGFTSGDELVRTLAAAPSPQSEIDAITDRKMLEQYGDLSSAEAIDRAADKAIHNAARARFVATEANALAKATGRPRVLAAAAKEFAANLISRLKLRDIKPGQYTAAAARAAKAAHKASKAGDLAAAATEKRNELINLYAAKAAFDGREEASKMLAYFKRFDTVSKTLDVDYREQIEALLERFDLRTSTSLKAVDKRNTLAAWMETQREMGLEPDVPDALLNEALRKSVKDMTLEELRGLRDTVMQIEHLGRLKHKLLTAQDQREFALIVSEAGDSIIDNGGTARPVQLEEPTGVLPWLEGMAAGHRKFASLLRQMDGGQDAGPLWRILGRTMNEAGVQESVMIEHATLRLTEIYAPVLALKGGIHGDKQFIPEIQDSLTRGGRLAVMLNWGNAANRQRVMAGDNWTEAQVMAIQARLTRVELEFLNNTWAYIDGYWPQIAAKARRVTGVVPEKVEASPFKVALPDGTTVELTGGYYPIKYDANRDDKAEKHDAAALASDMMRGAFTRATTRRGHTKARVEEVKRPVKKTLDVLTQHVTEVVHDLSWHEWLIDANRLINARPINNAIRTYYGTAVLRTMKDALVGIATADVIPQTAIDQALLHLRANISRSTMGLSLTTALMQPFGLTQSMQRIGAPHVLRGLARWGGDALRFESSLTWINGKSDFMRLRGKTFNRELHEIRGRVSQGHSRPRQIYDASLFMLMQKMQLVADVPTWIGGYEKAIANGQDEETAVALADQGVLDSQGSGQTKDMAELQRKHPMLSMFYSYFNVTYNLAAESTAGTDFKNPLAVAGWMSDMMLLMVIPAMGPALLIALLRGDDDWDDWQLKLLKWQASYLLGTAMGMRELGSAVAGFDYTGPPVGRIVGDFGKLGQQVAQGEADEGLAFASIRLLGSATGVPTVQLLRSWRGWKAWEDGESPAGAVLLGPPPRE